MTPRSILAVTDFSIHGDKALDRAALLSAEHGAVLKLACLAYPGEAPPSDAATGSPTMRCSSRRSTVSMSVP